jgi:NADPH2:quinone reductase
VPYATAQRAFERASARAAGETVLIHGASGGVGIAAVQLARARGMTIIAPAEAKRGALLSSRKEPIMFWITRRKVTWMKL